MLVFSRVAGLPSTTYLIMTASFTLAHLSDLHLAPVTGFTARYWNAKRALGYLNWQRARKSVHQRSVADRLEADALALRADHIAITGDLINLGLPAEYDAALQWLKSVGPPDRVTVVPGNHDIYTRLHGHGGVSRWAAYMGSEEQSLAFPFVRRVGPVALVGLNSAVETPPFVAAGQLGAHQIEVAGELLDQLKSEGAVRVVLIHHPPLPGLANARRGLRDAAHFARMLEIHGAELVLYGHNHHEKLDWHVTAVTPGKPSVPVIGVPSASAGKLHKHEPLARYTMFTFFHGASGVRFLLAVRGIV